LVPGQIDFVQPHADTRVSFDLWGTTVSYIEDPKLDNPWIWSHELARNLRRGVAERSATAVHFNNLVGDYQRSLLLRPGLAPKTASTLEALVEAGRHIH
jgi:hypothetical protein